MQPCLSVDFKRLITALTVAGGNFRQVASTHICLNANVFEKWIRAFDFCIMLDVILAETKNHYLLIKSSYAL